MPQPRTLAIDTAAPRLNLALAFADGRTDSLVDEIAKGHAELLFERLGTLLDRNGLGYEDIERVAVTTGPGSFTGLRIGLSAARGLALARGVPVLGIPSLLALSLAAQTGPVAVLLDARREEAYFELFAEPGMTGEGPALLPMAVAQAAVPAGTRLITSPFVDIAAMARFAALALPARFPPHATYVRDADAKPQDAARIPRRLP